MRIIVTGAAGFIGSHVAAALLADGHDVFGIDDLSSGFLDNVPQGVALETLDIRDQRAAEFIRFTRPEVLVHHAGQIDVRASVASPTNDADINVIGSLRMFEACLASGCRRVVFASTGGAIYGDQCKFPAEERTLAQPASPYGVSKLAVEHYLSFYVAQHGFRAASLRYANVYGPRQSPRGEAGVVAIFSDRLLRGLQIEIHGDGEQTRDFVYVDDVARANVLAIRHGLTGAYNVGTGIETSVNALYTDLCAVAKSRNSPVHRPAKPGEQRRSSIDASKLSAQTGWTPAWKLLDGLELTYASFRDRVT